MGNSDICAGYPTLYAHEKILKKVKPLVEIGKAEKIHFSSCMVKLLNNAGINNYASFEEYTNVVLFLASDESKFITGTELVADGGETAGQADWGQ